MNDLKGELDAVQKQQSHAGEALNRKYLAILKKWEASSKKSENWRAVLNARREYKRFKADPTIPASDASDLDPQIIKLRKSIRATHTQLEQTTSRTAKQKIAACQKSMQNQIEQLVADDQLDAALVLQKNLAQLKNLGHPLLTQDRENSSFKPKGAKATHANIQQSLVIVVNGPGTGSGFIARMNGKEYIFTNQHVIQGGKSLSFRFVNGESIKPTKLEVADIEDLARISFNPSTVKSAYACLDVFDGVPAERAPISVYGNSLGAGVVTHLTGQVLKVEDRVIQITAPFVPGNSGSPIMNSSFKVVGVASYLFRDAEEFLNKNKQAVRVRTERYGYRITPETQWLSVSSGKWLKKGADLHDIKHFIDELVVVLRSIRTSEKGLYVAGNYNVTEKKKNYTSQVWPNSIADLYHSFGVRGRNSIDTDKEVQKTIKRLINLRTAAIRKNITGQKWPNQWLANEAKKLLETADKIDEAAERKPPEKK